MKTILFVCLILFTVTPAAVQAAVQAAVTSIPPSYGKLGLSKNNIGRYLREQIKDSSNFPYRIVGQIEVGCTGTIIGPSQILTAGHCVYNVDKKQWYENLDFFPGRVSETELPFGKVTWKKVFVQEEFLESGDTAYDFAVIELASPIGNQLGWSGMKVLPESEYTNRVRITGYPGDKPAGTMWTVTCPSSVEGTTINYLCDTYGGMSGSGVYSINPDPNQTYLTSVHLFGSYNSNGGVILDAKNFAHVLSWRNGNNLSANTVIHEKN